MCLSNCSAHNGQICVCVFPSAICIKSLPTSGSWGWPWWLTIRILEWRIHIYPYVTYEAILCLWRVSNNWTACTPSAALSAHLHFSSKSLVLHWHLSPHALLRLCLTCFMGFHHHATACSCAKEICFVCCGDYLKGSKTNWRSVKNIFAYIQVSSQVTYEVPQK